MFLICNESERLFIYLLASWGSSSLKRLLVSLPIFLELSFLVVVIVFWAFLLRFECWFSLVSILQIYSILCVVCTCLAKEYPILKLTHWDSVSYCCYSFPNFQVGLCATVYSKNDTSLNDDRECFTKFYICWLSFL